MTFATTALLVGTSQRRSNRAACGALQDFILTNQAMDLDTHASPAHWVKSHHFSIQQVVRCAPKAKRPGWRARRRVQHVRQGDLVHFVAHVHQGCIARAEIQTRQNVIGARLVFIKNQKSKPCAFLALLGCTKMNRDRTNALNARKAGKPLTWNNQNVYSVKSVDLPKLRDSLCARTVVPASTARTLESALPVPLELFANLKTTCANVAFAR